MKFDRNHNRAEFDAPPFEELLGYVPVNLRDIIRQFRVFLKVMFPEWAEHYVINWQERLRGGVYDRHIEQVWKDQIDPACHQERLHQQVEVWSDSPSTVITRLDRLIQMDSPVKPGYDDKSENNCHPALDAGSLRPMRFRIGLQPSGMTEKIRGSPRASPLSPNIQFC